MNIVKYLQVQGVSSKKGCQTLVTEGYIKINQELISSLKTDIEPEQVSSLIVDDEMYHVIPLPYFCILMNKPKDFEVSHKPRDYPSIFSLLPNQIKNLPLQAIGRLDVDTTGLLLVTNDGRLNHRLTSPKHEVEKEYLIGLKHVFTLQQQEALLRGVVLKDDHDEIVIAKNIQILDEKSIKMIITSGKYHQVKRMLAAAGNRVESLHRSRFGKLLMPDNLASGAWCFIDSESLG